MNKLENFGVQTKDEAAEFCKRASNKVEALQAIAPFLLLWQDSWQDPDEHIKMQKSIAALLGIRYETVGMEMARLEIALGIKQP